MTMNSLKSKNTFLAAPRFFVVAQNSDNSPIYRTVDKSHFSLTIQATTQGKNNSLFSALVVIVAMTFMLVG